MALTQAFKRKNIHSIPSWYEESKKYLKLAEQAMFANFGGQKTYLEADFEVLNIELASATI